MGHLVMSFMGICMNVRKEAGLPYGVGHRVVATNLLKETPTDFGPLPPHVCFMQFLTPSVADLMMIGWNVRVGNAIGPLSVDLRVQDPQPDLLDAVPSLTTYDPTMVIREDLLAAGPPAQAACFVDISNGTVSAQQFANGGIYTVWQVETDGDPELILTPRDGVPLRLIIPTIPLGSRFPPPADVPGFMRLSNAAVNAEDKQFDFVLHYEAAVGGIPAKFQVPPPQDLPRAATPPHPFTDFGTTTSCSNSQYP